MEDILKKSSNFIAACYSMKGEHITMSLVQQNVWSSQVGKAPSCVWKQATELDPHEWNPVDYEWEKNEATKSLNPVMLPKNIKIASPEVLRVLVEVSLHVEPSGVVVTVLNFPVPSFEDVRGVFCVLMNRQSILNL